jgi:hypothetical protein
MITEPAFPDWPDDCPPQRFFPRPVEFEPAEAPEGFARYVGKYTNPLAAHDFVFPLSVTGPDEDREALKAFADGLRFWIEAFPQAGQHREKAHPRHEFKPPEGLEDAVPFTVEIGAPEGAGPLRGFFLVDPPIDTVHDNRTHRYTRPSPGDACITVYRGTAELQGAGANQRVTAGHTSARRAAGTACAVYGITYAEYSISGGWNG